jgi:hypothetical protein
MSPTSYQTAPPRALMITTASVAVKPAAVQKFRADPSYDRGFQSLEDAGAHLAALVRRFNSLLQFWALTGIYNFRRINRRVVYLLFQNAAVFTD